MSEVAVIGAQPHVAGFALAGARVVPAETAEQVRAAWAALPSTVGFVVLTRTAAEVLAADVRQPNAPLTVVMPR